MADLSTTPPPPFPRPPLPPPPKPPAPTVLLPHPSIPVRDTNLSNLSPSPAPLSDIKPAPRPVPLPPPPTPKSTIRTMASDIASLQKVPAPAPPIKPSIHVKPFIPPPPQGGGMGKTPLIIGIIIVLIGLVFVLWLVMRSGDPTSTPLPTPLETPSTPEPTPEPIPTFEDIYNPRSSLKYNNKIISEETLGIGELKFYFVENGATGSRVNFRQFANDMGIAVPASLLTSIGDQFYFTLFGKTDGTTGRGMAVKITDVSSARAVMTDWEAMMPIDLKNIFQINKAKAATQRFLDKVYGNTDIRYMNFPDPLKTIDYTMITLKSQDVYLIMTNSRDHMFAVVNKSANQLVGK